MAADPKHKEAISPYTRHQSNPVAEERLDEPRGLAVLMSSRIRTLTEERRGMGEEESQERHTAPQIRSSQKKNLLHPLPRGNFMQGETGYPVGEQLKLEHLVDLHRNYEMISS